MNEKTSSLLVLGIESSCDDTSVAILRSDGTILSNIVRSQYAAHQPYGGVVPEIAARAHLEQMESVLDEALKEAAIKMKALDAIAVTSGPGLIGGVIVGVMTAKALASIYQKPLIAINHLEGHALTARLTDQVAFPYLLLLVSGGHCQILIVHAVGEYTLLGKTQDDALGEAFDKVAKMMGLSYPGGPIIEKLAKQGDATRFDLPRPLLDRKGCDFSFSGLKTAVRYRLQETIRQGESIDESFRADMAASFQAAVGDILYNRISHALQMTETMTEQQTIPPLQNVVMAGGVAANHPIRQRMETLCTERGYHFHVPPVALCTDNAAMIAWAGLERLQQEKYLCEEPITPKARWPLTEIAHQILPS